MKFSPNIVISVAIIAVTGATVSVAMILDAKWKNKCDSECRNRKSIIIENQCLCASDAGWTKASIIERPIVKPQETKKPHKKK